MIQIDSRVGSKELLPLLRGRGIECELTNLVYGDASIGGNGPDGPIAIGVERKTLNDMLQCIEDARYSAHQLPGMMRLYTRSFLMLEGMWACGDGNGMDGLLFQGYRRGQSWGPLKTRGNRTPPFTKLFNYMTSVAMAGVIITYPSDIVQSALQLKALHDYFQKPWKAHTSLRELQKFAMPTMNTRPSVVMQWARALDGIGLEYSEAAEKVFRSGRHLATADESDWMKLGIGAKTARRIVREINGWK